MTPDEVLVYELQPDIARAYLKRAIHGPGVDAVLDDIRAAVEVRLASTIDDGKRAVLALECCLDRELPEHTLLGWVEFDANVGLVDSSDAGARAWLEQLVTDLRDALGPYAPPPRGTHQLDRRR